MRQTTMLPASLKRLSDTKSVSFLRAAEASSENDGAVDLQKKEIFGRCCPTPKVFSWCSVSLRIHITYISFDTK
jgi:hypothetical protein